MKKIFTLFLIALLGMGQAWAISKTQLTVNINGNGQIAVNTSAAQPSGWSSTSVTKDQSHGGVALWEPDTYYIWVNPNSGYYCSGVSECTWDNNGYYTITFTGSTGTTKKTVTATFVGNSYTLTFDGNGATGGTMANQNFAAFAGWAKSANGEVVYANQQSLSTPTPLPSHNSTINLFAKWNEATVVLPEVSREGLLFDGWYNGDVWAGNIGDTYVVTADAELTAHWAAKRTPVFVLDKTEIELDQTAQLTMSNVNNPAIEINPTGIVSYDAESGVLTGIGVGEVTITATQQETDELSYKQEELTLNVTKKTASLSVLLNGIEQNSVVIYQGKTTTVSFNKVSDAEVVVEAISGAQHASYYDGVLTAGEIGTATFRATLPETDTYKSTYVDFTVETQKDPVHLPMDFTQALWNNPNIKVGTNNSVEWDGDNGIHLGDGGGGGLTYNDKWVTIHFVGVPDKLSFEYSYDYRQDWAKPSAVFTGQTADPNKMYFLFVEESADNNTWTALTWQDTDPFRNSWKQSGALQLKKTTRYVRLHYNANLGAYYRNIHISELKYVDDPVPASVDFGTKIIYSGEESATVNVNWCNIAPLSVTCTNPKFTVSPSSFANYDQYGSQAITIGYTHTDEVGDFSGEVVISNGNDTYTKTIPVHAQTTKRIQTINWNADLEGTGFAMNVGEQYPDEVITVIATAQNGGQVVFTSSDNDIIEVVDDTILVAKAVGTAEITAYQAGDNEYAEVTDTKTFTVTMLQKQTITWEQNLYGLLTTSDPVELTAEATSGMEITYVSADESVVRVEGNVLYVVGEGETYITATQAGGLDSLDVEWLEVSAVNYVIVRNPASQCNEMAMTQASLELNADHLSQEFALVGVPAGLTFTAKHGEKSTQWGTGASYATLVVEQYSFRNGVWDWYQVFNQVVGTDAANYGEFALDESATKIRFATGERATNHTITNIRVPRKKFMRADVTAIDEEAEANAIWQKTITVSHSNIDLMTVSTARGVVSLNTATLGEGCGDFGDDAFIASFTTTQKGIEYLDTIIVTDGKAQPTTLLIPVRLVSTGLKQHISDFVLPKTCLTTDEVEVLPTTATSDLEVVYLSSDSTIAYVENNQLVILSAGPVQIIAYQAGDERFNEASLAKMIEIQLTPSQIIEAPTATEMAIGAPLSMSQLQGGLASVEGTFAWQNPDQIMNEGGFATVVFTPTLSNIYAPATAEVLVPVVENPTIYVEYTAEFCEGDSIELYGEMMEAVATEEGEPIELTFEGANQYGGDSIVYLTIIVHQAEMVELYDTMYIGDTLRVEPGVWTESEYQMVLDQAEYPMDAENEFELVQHTQTEFGCDKTIVWYVKVTKKPVGTGIEDVQSDDVQCTKILRDGVIYIRRDGKEYTITGLEVK